MTTFYLRVDKDNIIQDAITYPHEGFVPFETDLTHLPVGVNGGWFKFENNELIEVPELKPINRDKELELLKQSQAEQDEILLQLLMSSTGGA